MGDRGWLRQAWPASWSASKRPAFAQQPHSSGLLGLRGQHQSQGKPPHSEKFKSGGERKAGKDLCRRAKGAGWSLPSSGSPCPVAAGSMSGDWSQEASSNSHSMRAQASRLWVTCSQLNPLRRVVGTRIKHLRHICFWGWEKREQIVSLWCKYFCREGPGDHHFLPPSLRVRITCPMNWPRMRTQRRRREKTFGEQLPCTPSRSPPSCTACIRGSAGSSWSRPTKR